jgi:hypothetical protein
MQRNRIVGDSRAIGRGALLAVGCAALLAAGCGNGGSGASSGSPAAAAELSAAGNGSYLGIQQVSQRQDNGDWTDLFYDPAKQQAICLTGTQYQVSVHHGTSKDVLLYLEGGGACWNFNNCYAAPLAKTTANSAIESGALDIHNPQSPFKDMNIVYASYCDGSVFAGDNTVDYNGHQTFHHGQWNLTAAVDAIKNEFANPSRIIVSGSSAGGYGTYSAYSVVRVAFPGTPVITFDDSGPGLQNPDATQDVQDREQNWQYTKFIPASCTNCVPDTGNLAPWALARDPGLRLALYSYQQDGVISSFLHYDGPSYQTVLFAFSDAVNAQFPDRFKRFFPKGSGHTILELPAFYTQSIRSESIHDWTQAFLDNSPGWQDTIE